MCGVFLRRVFNVVKWRWLFRFWNSVQFSLSAWLFFGAIAVAPKWHCMHTNSLRTGSQNIILHGMKYIERICNKIDAFSCFHRLSFSLKKKKEQPKTNWCALALTIKHRQFSSHSLWDSTETKLVWWCSCSTAADAQAHQIGFKIYRRFLANRDVECMRANGWVCVLYVALCVCDAMLWMPVAGASACNSQLKITV